MAEIQALTSIQQLKLKHGTVSASESGKSFSAVFQERASASGVRFSKHASARISERGVNLTDSLVQDLNQAVEKAKEKGAKDVVIIGAQNAFIVNIPNNLVVTTMNSQEMKESIFTNIDSAVLI
ncbi:MAG: flagellar biosynthesis protein [Ruminococcus sp.]|nr:flagellar biosynthesis protein [Ruminococcus sp.]